MTGDDKQVLRVLMDDKKSIEREINILKNQMVQKRLQSRVSNDNPCLNLLMISVGTVLGLLGCLLFASMLFPTDKPVSTTNPNIVVSTHTPIPTLSAQQVSTIIVEKQTATSIPTIVPTVAKNLSIIYPGTYLIGSEILPGTYKGNAGDGILGSCYWARLSNLSGGLDGIIANDNAMNQFYVQIYSSDYAFITRCKLERIGD